MSSQWLPSQLELQRALDTSAPLKTLCQKLWADELPEPLHQKSSLAKSLLGKHIDPLYEEEPPGEEDVGGPSDLVSKRPRLDDSFASCLGEEDSTKESSRILFEDLTELLDQKEQSLNPYLSQLQNNNQGYLGSYSLEAEKLVVLVTQVLGFISEDGKSDNLLRIVLESLVKPSLLSLGNGIPRGLHNSLLELFTCNPHSFARYVLCPLAVPSSGKEDAFHDFLLSCISLKIPDDIESVKAQLFPIYFSLPRASRNASLPLMESLAFNPGLLRSTDNQDILINSLLAADSTGGSSKCSKLGKFLLGVLKSLPVALRADLHSKLTELTSRHSSFLKKSILNELSKKTAMA